MNSPPKVEVDAKVGTVEVDAKMGTVQAKVGTVQARVGTVEVTEMTAIGPKQLQSP